jgi:hypothetical protein
VPNRGVFDGLLAAQYRRHIAFAVESLFPGEQPSPEDLLIAAEEANMDEEARRDTTDTIPISGTSILDRNSPRPLELWEQDDAQRVA